MPVALVSVSDKTGLVPFASSLASRGWTFLASGGSARTLSSAGLPVQEVAEYTASPEFLGGRVKTLHPAIHGGILARLTRADEAELASRGWGYIDLVIVNLYPFEETIARPESTEAEGVENIDIGGVALIRAAAKNFDRVTLVCDPEDYPSVETEILDSGACSPATRRRLAAKGFDVCTRYDAAIAGWLSGGEYAYLCGLEKRTLRYGENPHQSGSFYSAQRGQGPLGGTVLQGKELSYNNILDLDSAWRAALLLGPGSAVIVQHLSPGGCAQASTGSGSSMADVLKASIACDPVSAYGGVIATSSVFDGDCARALGELFVECIAAPGFSEEARTLLGTKKNLRLLEIAAPDAAVASLTGKEIRSVAGGFLLQDVDAGDPDGTEWKVVSRRSPTDVEWRALRFAWEACVAVKSNGILLAASIGIPESASTCLATVGIGGGQPNRVDSVRIAASRAGARASGSVLASDAFFPFPDSVVEAAKAGVTAIVHPGGSIRDALSVEAADAAGMAMVVTGVRHFRH